MKKIIIIILILSSCSGNLKKWAIVDSNTLNILLEYNYMRGQIDYSKGDIRVEQRKESYYWIKGPWNLDSEQFVFESQKMYIRHFNNYENEHE